MNRYRWLPILLAPDGEDSGGPTQLDMSSMLGLPDPTLVVETPPVEEVKENDAATGGAENAAQASEETPTPATVESAQGASEASETPAEESEEVDSETPQTNAALLEQLNRMAAELQRLQAGISTPAAKTENETPQQAVPAVPTSAAGFDISEDEVEAAQDDPKKMVGLFKKVYSKALQDVSASMPALVMSEVRRQVDLQVAVTDFYKQNPELVNLKPLAATIAGQLQAAHPDWDMQKLFSETASEVKKLIGQQVKDGKAAPKGRRPPAFSPRPSGPPAANKPELKGEEKDIADLFDFAQKTRY